MSPLGELRDLDAIIVAVAHDAYVKMGTDRICATVRDGDVVVDVKSLIDPVQVLSTLRYWSL